MISNSLVEFSLFFKIPSSIDLLLTQTLISSFFRPPNFAIFNKDLKGSWDLVQSFCFLYKTFKKLKEHWGSIDFLVHAIGFSNKEELRGRYIETSKENFTNTLAISTFSLTEVAKKAESILNQGGSILTLTYYGSEKVLPHYNVMGVAKAALESSVRYLAMDLGKKNIRVNSLSAGTIKTLAASGIGDFRYIMKWNELNSPLKRNVTQNEVGKAALFLLSDMSSGVTGENLHVDSGYHIVGMKAEDAPDIDVVTGRKENDH